VSPREISLTSAAQTPTSLFFCRPGTGILMKCEGGLAAITQLQRQRAVRPQGAAHHVFFVVISRDRRYFSWLAAGIFPFLWQSLADRKGNVAVVVSPADQRSPRSPLHPHHSFPHRLVPPVVCFPSLLLLLYNHFPSFYPTTNL
jgi:hypothetical protein